MAVGEQLTDDIQMLEQRAHELAMDAGKKAAEKAEMLLGGVLGRHPEIVDVETATRIEANEFDRGFDIAIEARESGRLNDNYSTAPGITIFMNAAAAERITREGEANPEGYYAKYMEDLEPMDEEDRIYALYLPEGAYSMDEGHCMVYGEAEFGERRPLEGKRLLPFHYEEIVRVEGITGDLWQNTGYQPDGTPIEHS